MFTGIIKIVSIALLIIGVKLLLNIKRYTQIKRFYESYKKYVNDPKWDFHEDTHKIIKLFNDAGIKDSLVASIEPIGFGYVRTGNASTFKNMTVIREDIVNLMHKFFHESIGIYRSRIYESFSPFYWIETIIFLPNKIFKYFGLNAERGGYKIIQVIYWIIWILISVQSLISSKFIENLQNLVISIFY